MPDMPPEETVRSALQVSHDRLRKQHELVVKFGLMSLKTSDLDALLTEACATTASGMNIRYAKILKWVAQDQDFLLSHGVGWDDSDIGVATVGSDDASPAGYAFMTLRPVISNHLGQEQRFRTPSLLKKYGIERAINVPIRGTAMAYGVLEADSSEGDDFIESDLVFLEGLANVISMALERFAAEAHAEQARPYSESVLNASPDCVHIISADGAVEFFNQSALRQFQLDCFEQVKGLPWLQLWPDGSQADVKLALEQALRGESTRFEAACPTARGEPRWWDVTVAPVLAEGQRVDKIIAVSRDITERHLHEAKLVSLIDAQNNKLSISDAHMEEIHHRVKNSLHLVNTLLLLQANLAVDEAVRLQLQTAAGRVVTIASVHERLYQNADTQSVNASDYLHALLGDIGKALADRQIQLTADAFVLPPERMAPLGLVISELITNALKYGKGTIEVTVKACSGFAQITVTDEGDGFPQTYPKPTGTGLGMRLVKSYSGYGEAAITVDRAVEKSRIQVRFKL